MSLTLLVDGQAVAETDGDIPLPTLNQPTIASWNVDPRNQLSTVMIVHQILAYEITSFDGNAFVFGRLIASSTFATIICNVCCQHLGFSQAINYVSPLIKVPFLAS